MTTVRSRTKPNAGKGGRKAVGRSARNAGAMAMPPAASVDEYLAAFPKEARDPMAGLRRIIKAAAPRAQEGISYRMPFYKLKGPLVGFAGYAHHVGLYGISLAIQEAYRKELESYETSRGTVRLPIGKPLPVALVRKLIVARVKENEAAAARRAH